MTAPLMPAPSTDVEADARPDATAASHSERVGELFKAHNQALVSYLAVRLQSTHEAKEVAQEAYVRLLQLDRPGPASFLRAYLFRVAANLAIDRQRRRGRHTRFEQAALFEELLQTQDGPERSVLGQESVATISACLKELPEKFAQALVMYRLDELSQDDIAQRLGVTSRMVRYYLTYALNYCRLRVEGFTPQQARERAES